MRGGTDRNRTEGRHLPGLDAGSHHGNTPGRNPLAAPILHPDEPAWLGGTAQGAALLAPRTRILALRRGLRIGYPARRVVSELRGSLRDRLSALPAVPELEAEEAAVRIEQLVSTAGQEGEKRRPATLA